MKSVLIVATALLVSVPAVAQQQDQPRQHEDHALHMGMMAAHCPMLGGATPAMILHHADELGLSADQAQRIEAIRDQTDVAAHMQDAMAAHRQAAELVRGERPDLAAHEAKLREAADHMILAHTSMARATVEARDVLTAEQQERLTDQDHAAMGHAEALGHAGAMGSGGMAHGAMGKAHTGMMGCPMMREMHGSDPEAPGAKHH